MATMVSPSLLSADFLNLSKDVAMINNSDADWLHLDIMDGMFVPNISFGFSVLEALPKELRKPMDVHYMIMHPEDYIERTARIGAMSMNVHVEACGERTREILERIHAAGMKAAVTIRPDTPVKAVEPYLDVVEMVLVMGVHPGFGGQKFIPATVDRVRELKAMIKASGRNVLIEVDGGVDKTTAPVLVEAGCDVLVSGSYIFKAENPYETIKQLRAL